MTTAFETWPLPRRFIDNMRKAGITEPTPIQEEAIPVILEGRDVIAQSQTGTGKTLAYLLPVMARLEEDAKATQAVILVPTRELGMQIVQEAEKLAEGTGLRVQQLIGGASLSRQLEKLKQHPQLVVGTPGRVLELITKRKLSLHRVRSIVVDEVDQVFDLGSKAEVDKILGSALRDRQILFFSATITAAIRSLAGKWMKGPAELAVKPEERAASTLTHYYLVGDERDKIDLLRRAVRHYNPKAAIVFIGDTEDIAEVAAKIRFTGLSIEALYGDSGKQERAKVMSGFREGRFQLLLATDVAARGLDFPGVTHVINFDLPLDAEHYVHRAGRTGRMGRTGTVISLLTERQRFIVDKYAKALGVSFEERKLYGGQSLAPADLRGGRGPSRSAARPGKPERVNPASAETAGSADTASVRPARTAERAEEPKASAPEKPKRAAAAGNSPRSKSTRDRDRKAKGAPKWLKEKQERDKRS